jgi:hypothetical protein
MSVILIKGQCYRRKNGVFYSKYYYLGGKNEHNFFYKNAFFTGEKLAKLAENSDRNIDPRCGLTQAGSYRAMTPHHKKIHFTIFQSEFPAEQGEAGRVGGR